MTNAEKTGGTRINTQVGCSEMRHPWWKAGGPNSGHPGGAQGITKWTQKGRIFIPLKPTVLYNN